MKKEKTAVDWLVQEANLLENNGWILPLIEQAKAMEEERIKNERKEAYDNGYANGQMDAFTN